MYPFSETDPRYWTMFRCFKYLCSAISSWRGWEYLSKKKQNQGLFHHAGKGSRLCLNASLTTEWILGITIQFSANILSMTFKMQSDSLPIQKKIEIDLRATLVEKHAPQEFVCVCLLYQYTALSLTPKLLSCFLPSPKEYKWDTTST